MSYSFSSSKGHKLPVEKPFVAGDGDKNNKNVKNNPSTENFFGPGAATGIPVDFKGAFSTPALDVNPNSSTPGPAFSFVPPSSDTFNYTCTLNKPLASASDSFFRLPAMFGGESISVSSSSNMPQEPAQPATASGSEESAAKDKTAEEPTKNTKSQRLQKKIDLLEKRIENLEGDVERRNRELKRHEGTFEWYESEIQNLTNSLGGKDHIIFELQTILNANQGESRAMNEQGRLLLEQAKKFTELQAAFSDLQANASEKQAIIWDHEGNIIHLENTLEGAEQNTRHERQKTQRLEAQLREVQVAVSDLQANATEKQAIIWDYERNIVHLKNTLEGAEQNLRDERQNTQRLEAQLSEIQTTNHVENEKKFAELAAMPSAISLTSEELEKHNQRCDELNVALIEAKTEIGSQKEALENMTSHHEGSLTMIKGLLEQECAKSKDLEIALSNAKAEMQANNQTMGTTINNLETTIGTIKGLLQQERSKSEDLEAALKSAKSEIQASQINSQTMDTTTNNLKTTIGTIKDSLQQERSKSEDLETALKHAKGEIQVNGQPTVTTIKNLETTIGTIKGLLQQERSKSEDLEAALKNAKSEIQLNSQSLEQTINHLETTLAATSGEFEQEKQKCRRLEATLREAKTEIETKDRTIEVDFKRLKEGQEILKQKLITSKKEIEALREGEKAAVLRESQLQEKYSETYKSLQEQGKLRRADEERIDRLERRNRSLASDLKTEVAFKKEARDLEDKVAEQRLINATIELSVTKVRQDLQRAQEFKQRPGYYSRGGAGGSGTGRATVATLDPKLENLAEQSTSSESEAEAVDTDEDDTITDIGSLGKSSTETTAGSKSETTGQVAMKNGGAGTTKTTGEEVKKSEVKEITKPATIKATTPLLESPVIIPRTIHHPLACFSQVYMDIFTLLLIFILKPLGIYLNNLSYQFTGIKFGSTEPAIRRLQPLHSNGRLTTATTRLPAPNLLFRPSTPSSTTASSTTLPNPTTTLLSLLTHLPIYYALLCSVHAYHESHIWLAANGETRNLLSSMLEAWKGPDSLGAALQSVVWWSVVGLGVPVKGLAVPG